MFSRKFTLQSARKFWPKQVQVTLNLKSKILLVVSIIFDYYQTSIRSTYNFIFKIKFDIIISVLSSLRSLKKRVNNLVL